MKTKAVIGPQNNYPELERINELVFNVCGFILTDILPEPEARDYSGQNFKLNGTPVKFRKAKITPSKTGQFVSIWKRGEHGITRPFDSSDDFELYLVLTQSVTNLGLFIFPKSALIENKILSHTSTEGKRGIRVYPPWDLTTNKQAQKTQAWQTTYFLDLSKDGQTDIKQAQNLLSVIIETNN